jgi:hypothetical protein
MASPPEQFRAEQKAVWDFVDQNYCSRDVLGEKASQAIRQMAARASHHEFPFGMGVLSNLISCTNGAKTQLFPGSLAPLVLACINNNYPQTRKSSGHRAGLAIGSAIDEHVLADAKAKVLASLRATAEAEKESGGRAKPVPDANHPGIKSVRVESSTLTAFTEAAFFQRTSGDFDQLLPSQWHDLLGRIFFGTSVNLDEAYRFLKMVGLIPNSASAKSNDSSNAMAPDAASEFNKLLQTGVSTMTTKTAGAFGQGDAPTVSLGLGGNGHPAIIVPMLRGTFGNDSVAVSFRLLFSSGRPIEPYAALPLGLQLPPDFKRWLWPKLLACMVAPLGLPAGVQHVDVARNSLEKARVGLERNDSDDEEQEPDGLFMPDKSGYVVTLVDGTQTRIRFRRALRREGEQMVPEFRSANRDVPITEGLDLKSMAKRVLQYFRESHKEVPWALDARLTFTGFQTVLDAQCAVARDQGNESLAARLGAGPWHLGMLSVALLVLEIAVDEEGVKNGHGVAVVEATHVVRAWEVLNVFHGIRDIYEAGPPAARTLASQRLTQRDAAERRVAGALVQLDGRSGWAEFAMTQATAATQPGDAATSAAPLPGVEGLPASETLQPSELPSVDVAPTPGYLMISDPQVPAMDVGYGEGGASVQVRVGDEAVHWSDREIMKKTLLRGESVVFMTDVCDSIRKNVPVTPVLPQGKPKTKSVSLKTGHWKAVMQAGLDMHRIGTYHNGDGEEEKKGHPRIRFLLPPADSPELQRCYHNRLMMLCGLSLQAFAEAIACRASKSKRKAPSVGTEAAAADGLAAGGSRVRRSALPAVDAGTAEDAAATAAAEQAPGSW